MSDTQSYRIAFIDIAKGIAMLWVVAVHTIPYTKFCSLLDWRSAFVLPVFFFISGCFHNKECIDRFCCKKALTLLVPFLGFEMLGIIENIFMILSDLCSWKDLLVSILHPWKTVLGLTWFLLALFLTSCIYRITEIIARPIRALWDACSTGIDRILFTQSCNIREALSFAIFSWSGFSYVTCLSCRFYCRKK